MTEKKKKPTTEDLLFRIEKLEARVAELQETICAGLVVAVNPDFKPTIDKQKPWV